MEKINYRNYILYEEVKSTDSMKVFRGKQVDLEHTDQYLLFHIYPLGSDDDYEAFEHFKSIAQYTNHTYITPVHDIITNNNTFALVYAPCQGNMVSQISGKLSENKILGFLEQICKGVNHYHKQGMLYNRVAPENIIISTTGNIQLYGIEGITFFDAEKNKGNVSSYGNNLYFSSPERLQAQEKKYQSDIYSIGCLGYFLLTGKYPFNGGLLEVLEAIEKQEYVPIRKENRKVGKELEGLLQNMFYNSPDKRPSTLDGVQRELERIKEKYETFQGNNMIDLRNRIERGVVRYFITFGIPLVIATAISISYIRNIEENIKEINDNREWVKNKYQDEKKKINLSIVDTLIRDENSLFMYCLENAEKSNMTYKFEYDDVKKILEDIHNVFQYDGVWEKLDKKDIKMILSMNIENLVSDTNSEKYDKLNEKLIMITKDCVEYFSQDIDFKERYIDRVFKKRRFHDRLNHIEYLYQKLRREDSKENMTYMMGLYLSLLNHTPIEIARGKKESKVDISLMARLNELYEKSVIGYSKENSGVITELLCFGAIEQYGFMLNHCRDMVNVNKHKKKLEEFFKITDEKPPKHSYSLYVMAKLRAELNDSTVFYHTKEKGVFMTEDFSRSFAHYRNSVRKAHLALPYQEDILYTYLHTSTSARHRAESYRLSDLYSTRLEPKDFENYELTDLEKSSLVENYAFFSILEFKDRFYPRKEGTKQKKNELRRSKDLRIEGNEKIKKLLVNMEAEYEKKVPEALLKQIENYLEINDKYLLLIENNLQENEKKQNFDVYRRFLKYHDLSEKVYETKEKLYALQNIFDKIGEKQFVIKKSQKNLEKVEVLYKVIQNKLY